MSWPLAAHLQFTQNISEIAEYLVIAFYQFSSREISGSLPVINSYC